MRVSVVYESLFGNTRAVAEAIAQGIQAAAPDAAVECCSAGVAGPGPGQADLLIVGGPTHFLGMPSARSRRIQEQNAHHGVWHHPDQAVSPPTEPPGVREWLDSLPAGRRGQRAAAFDTRLGTLQAGSAARQIARSLRRHGYTMTDQPQGFVVEDFSGPLAQGELARARAWGSALAARAGTGRASALRPLRAGLPWQV